MKVTKVEYQETISDREPEVCPTTCIMRYYVDRNNWIDVSVDPQGFGLTIRSAHAGLKVMPEASNTIRVEAQYL